MGTKKLVFILVAIVATVAAVVGVYQQRSDEAETPKEGDQVACTMDAKLCPDGSSVGRTGPECTFAECPSESVPDEVKSHIEAKADTVQLDVPVPGNYIASPLSIQGQARGSWFFEANFAVLLVDWDGRIIAEHYATAEDDWMTEDWVPFTSELTFTSPYSEGDPEFMKRGTLILQKANPSGLPEQADALEIPVWFTAKDNN